MKLVISFRDWIQEIGVDALVFLLKAAVAVILFLLLRFILKRVLNWMDKRLKEINLDPSVRMFLKSSLYIGILALALVTAIIKLKLVEVSAITTVLASVGVAVSLAIQGGLSNLAGGIMMLIMKPFRVGDLVRIPSLNLTGTVRKIEMYYTTIVDIENLVHKVPNSSLTDNQLVNYSVMDYLRLDLEIGIPYEADVEEARKVILAVLEEDTDVTPEYQIMVKELGDSAVILAVRGMTRHETYFDIKFRIQEKIKKALAEHDMAIPFPQLDVHMIPEKQS